MTTLGYRRPTRTGMRTSRFYTKALTVLAGMLLGTSAWAEPAPARFTDPKLSTCVSKALQKAGGVSTLELTKLNCNNQGITDATGINSLSNLQHLSLFGNRLKRIDLSGMVGLESLNIANNQLTKIDLSATNAIKTLYLFGNKLEQLNLEGLERLAKLKAEKNQLLAVQFAPKSALEKVYLFNNKMVDINIDTLTELKFIDVRSNPMPDEVYDYLDKFRGVKASHDGNTEDWK